MDARITAKHGQLINIVMDINKSMAHDHSGVIEFMITEEVIFFEDGYIEFQNIESDDRQATLYYMADFELEYIISIVSALAQKGFRTRTQVFIQRSDENSRIDLIPLEKNPCGAAVQPEESLIIIGYKFNESAALNSPASRIYIEHYCDGFETKNKLAI